MCGWLALVSLMVASDVVEFMYCTGEDGDGL